MWVYLGVCDGVQACNASKKFIPSTPLRSFRHLPGAVGNGLCALTAVVVAVTTAPKIKAADRMIM